MKKIVFCIMAMFLSLTVLQATATKTVPSDPKATTKTESAEASRILLRLNEIKAMDKSNLKASEKKALRKEVRASRERLKDISGGVYISVGVVILIIVLLIILL